MKKLVAFVMVGVVLMGLSWPPRITAQEGDDSSFHPDERVVFSRDGDNLRLSWSGDEGTCKLVPLFASDQLLPTEGEKFPSVEIRENRGWGESDCLTMDIEIKPEEWQDDALFGEKVIRVLLLRQTDGGWAEAEVIDVTSPIVRLAFYGQLTGDTKLLTRPDGSEIDEVDKGELVKVNDLEDGYYEIGIILDEKVVVGFVPKDKVDIAMWGSPTFMLFAGGYWIAIPQQALRDEEASIRDEYQHYLIFDEWVPLDGNFVTFFNNKSRTDLNYRLDLEEHKLWLPAGWVLRHSGLSPVWSDAWAWRLEGSLSED